MSRATGTQHSRRAEATPAETVPAPKGALKLAHVTVCGAGGTGKTTLIGALAGEGRDAGAPAPAHRHGAAVQEASATFSTLHAAVSLADTAWDEVGAQRMMAGAAVCDLAVVVADSRTGMDAPTRRSLFILSLLGVDKVALVVNKMDLTGFSQERFERICGEFIDFARQLGIEDAACIPASSLTGANVCARPPAMDWYDGPTLAQHLEAAAQALIETEAPFRMGVQEVVRSGAGLPCCAGTVGGGVVHPGDEVLVLPAGRKVRVESITGGEGEIPQAGAGHAVTLMLSDKIDVAVGDMLAAPDAPAEVSDQVACHVIWMGKEPMLPGRSYRMESGSQTDVATVTALKHKINVDNLDHIAGPTLQRDEIGFCNLSFNRPLVFDPYKKNRGTGSFVLRDRLTGETVGAGLIEFGLRRATNIHWQPLDIDKRARAGQKGQKPCVLWFTGLSGAGKSTIANLLDQRLHARGQHTYLLDGDNIRHGLNKDLGFTDADRVENIRRVAETAKLMVDAGLIVMASFISPFRSERRMARELFDEDEFIEIFVDTPLQICEQRDPKGLYQKARAGLIKNFTGIDSDYEPPERAEIRLLAGERGPELLVDELIALLEQRGAIERR